MKATLLLALCGLISCTSTPAQSIHRFSLQAGYLYASSTLTKTQGVLVGLSNFDPKPGYYLGVAYEHQLSTLLTSGLELSYQQKGYTARLSTYESRVNYPYLSLAPLMGVRPIKNLRLLIGPQWSLLINKSPSGLETPLFSESNRRFEFGLLARVGYQFHRAGLEAGYFTGLTAYRKADFYYLTNRCWQFGLVYQLNKAGSY